MAYFPVLQQITPKAGTTATVVTGGTAVTIITGPINGGYVTNGATAVAQGISTVENIYLDTVVSPASSDSAAASTTDIIQPGQTYTLQPLASGVVQKMNAATSGHKVTVKIY